MRPKRNTTTLPFEGEIANPGGGESSLNCFPSRSKAPCQRATVPQTAGRQDAETPTNYRDPGRDVSGPADRPRPLEQDPGTRPVVVTSVSDIEARTTDNDPSAGSPTETLLRLLLPLNATVWSSSRQPGRVIRQANSLRTSLKRSIGSSDGRCVQRAGTYSRRPRMSRHYGEFHVRGGRLQPPVPTVIEFPRLPGPLI